MRSDQVVPGEGFDWRRYDDIRLTPILSAALEALQENGYHGTTVRDIARRVGCTMPSLYYHHGSKEGILLALLDIAMGDVVVRVRAGVAEAGDDVRAQLENFVTAVAMHNTRRRDLAKLHPEFRFLGPESRTEYLGKRAVVDSALVSILENGRAEGIFRTEDSHGTARAILGMLTGINEWYQPGGKTPPQQIAVAYVGLARRLAGATETTRG